MARIRSVKPELRTSEVVASWPREVRYAFVLLWGYLDDKGRGLDVPKTIAGDCFPHDDDVTPAKMDKWLTLMATTKLDPEKDPPVCRYEVAGRRYLHTVNADEHQRPNRPTPSRIPPCPVHESLTESLSERDIDRPESKSGHGTVTKSTTGGSKTEKRGHGTVTKSTTGGSKAVGGSTRTPESAANPQVRDSGLTESPLSPHSRARVVDGAGELGDRSLTASLRSAAARASPNGPEPPADGEPGAAERIITGWIGALRKPPQARIVNAIGIIVQAALGEGQDPADVAEALRRWQERGKLGPAALPSVIHEVANGPTTGSNGTGQRRSTTDDRVAQALEVGRRLQAAHDQKAIGQ
jgi:hypothetical protein